MSENFNLNEIYNNIIKQLDNNFDLYEKSEYLESLKIGALIQISALYDGSIRLNIDDTPQKIIQTYCINISQQQILCYETQNKNIYVCATAYSAYYGFLDPEMNWHKLIKRDDLLGVQIDNNYILKKIIKLKKRFNFREIFSIKKHQKKIYTICNDNLGHYIWNEQPFVDFFIKYDMFKFIDKLAYTIDFLGLSDLFKIKKIPSYLLRKKNFKTRNILIHFSSVMYTEKTSKRLLVTTQKKDTDIEHSKIAILLHQRLTLRLWRQQKEGFANIINCICNKYKNVYFVIDGYSSPEYKAVQNNDSYIKKDFDYYNEWIKNLNDNNKSRVQEIFGKTCLEKILYYQAASLLVMSFGTPEHYNWITQKPVILYGPMAARSLSKILNSDKIINGLSIERTLIDNEFVKEYPDLSYDLDYKIILSEIEKQIEKFQNKTKKQVSL